MTIDTVTTRAFLELETEIDKTTSHAEKQMLRLAWDVLVHVALHANGLHAIPEAQRGALYSLEYHMNIAQLWPLQSMRKKTVHASAFSY